MYIKFQSVSQPVELDQAHLVPIVVNNLFTAPLAQGLYEICNKNTTKFWKTCIVRLHKGCFPVYRLSEW